MKKETKQGILIIGAGIILLALYLWVQFSPEKRFEEKTISTYRIERGLE